MDAGIIVLATLATVGRVFALIGVSILSGWGLGYFAIKNRRFENTYVPLVNVLESIPVIAFLPVVLIIFIERLGGSLGVEVAADFLVWDAVVWNIWIGIYQAFKTVPEHLIEVSDNYNFGFFGKMKELFIPHSIPRISSNIFSSFADALFYISVSEVFAVGITSYQTFGIGTLLTLFIQSGDLMDVYYSLLFIALAVIAVTFALTRFSRWAIARYGLDTVPDIRRHAGGWRARFGGSWRTLRKETGLVSKYAARLTPGRGNIDPSKRGFLSKHGRLLALAVVAVIAGYLLYSSYLLAASVSVDEWNHFFSLTPYLLYSMAADYLRVALVTLASFALAVSLGYVLAQHHRASQVIAPLIQTVAAFPAPAYFPLVFIFTLPFLENALPFVYVEIYIFILGFLSCFYYVFFDFWIGVQSVPSEFWEVMRNHEVGTLTRIRRVILPATLPYLVTGISSTINSAWAGIAIGEFWPNIDGTHTLQTGLGMMKYISSNMAAGDVADAAWVSLLFAIVVAVYGIFFTRNLMDVARKKYVVEEGIYAG